MHFMAPSVAKLVDPEVQERLTGPSSEGSLWPSSDSHVLNQTEALPPIKYCLFDLEATLFWSEEFKQRNYSQAIACLASFHNLPREQAQLTLRAKRIELSNSLGYIPALSTTLFALGVSLSEWAHYQSKVSENVIRFDKELLQHLLKLRNRYQLFLYTNMCEALKEAVLERLRIKSVFDSALSAQSVGYAKPNHLGIDLLIERHMLRPNSTIAVGDRYFLDIKPITDLGGWGYVVRSRANLFSLFKLLLR